MGILCLIRKSATDCPTAKLFINLYHAISRLKFIGILKINPSQKEDNSGGELSRRKALWVFT